MTSFQVFFSSSFASFPHSSQDSALSNFEFGTWTQPRRSAILSKISVIVLIPIKGTSIARNNVNISSMSLASSFPHALSFFPKLISPCNFPCRPVRAARFAFKALDWVLAAGCDLSSFFLLCLAFLPTFSSSSSAGSAGANISLVSRLCRYAVWAFIVARIN